MQASLPIPFHTTSSQPPPLRGTSFQRKEVPRVVISSECEKSFSFAIKKGCGGVGNGKHRAPCESGSRCFMQTDSRMKKKMANEKDPSAPLGMTIRDNAHPTRLSSRCDANLRPFGAPPSKGRRECNSSPASSFRANARNLFRSRSKKDVGGSGQWETPYSIRLGASAFHRKKGAPHPDPRPTLPPYFLA